jgi:hypothetical protein
VDEQTQDAQVVATIDLLLTVGYIDGQLHHGEAAFIRQYLDRLVEHVGRPRGSVGPLRTHVDECYARLEAELSALGAEVVATDDTDFMRTRLSVRAVSLFRAFSPADQKIALELLDAVIRMDGEISPQEGLLHAQLLSLFHAPATLPPPTLLPPTMFGVADMPQLAAAGALPLELTSDPLLDAIEQPYATDPAALHAQLHGDWNLIFSAITTWERLRAVGNGRLAGVTDITQLPPGSRFLDERVHVLRPDRVTELVVLGDLHGCYSCLKGALLQSRFIERVRRYQQDPARNPDVKLVLLGDYIDRGKYGFEGVLRAALQLLVTFPEHVVLLRGNHELMVRVGGHVISAVKPAEAVLDLSDRAPPELLEGYRHLFDHMPTSMLCERILMVHAGIPREDTIAERIRDLSSLNDSVARFEMMWSDPEATDHVPLELQRATPRFSFGSQQFSTFMTRLGCHTLIRGHEQVDTGFATVFDLPHCRLHTLFSAGGHDNEDLPADARYRRITPMALSIRMGDGPTQMRPWPIQYAPFCGAYR